jgi:U6 snRNA-associated Sm-like protein LSm1
MDSYLANVPFTTSGALVDSVDKKILVSLRDGRHLLGVLRSYDQYANLVLQDAVERIHVNVGADPSNPTGQFAEIWRGIYLVRGENVVLLGEIDLDTEDDMRESLQLAPIHDVMQRQQEEQDAQVQRVKTCERTLRRERGFSKEGDEGDRY